MKSVTALSIASLLCASACSSTAHDDEDGNPSSTGGVKTGSQGAAGASASGPNKSKSGILEVNVTNQPEFKNGQTAVIINPKDHNNLIFTATKHNLNTDEGLLGKEAWGCFVGYSTDRGVTWTTSKLPYGGTPSCGEPNPGVDADGNFYILFNKLYSFADDLAQRMSDTKTNKLAVSRSTDGGKTWSEPVEPPLKIGGQPKLAVDYKTGKLYAIGGYKFLFPSGISVSEDHGKTWSEARTLPMPDGCLQIPTPDGSIPCGFPGVQIAAYDGVLMTGISRGKNNNIEIYTSVDDAKTWTQTLLKDGKGNDVPAAGELTPSDPGGGEDPLPWVTADDTKKDHFAAMIPRGETLEVYVTENAGKSWSGPAVINAPDKNRPWINFGMDGGLGVMWRTNAVDAFSVFSFDGGKTFSKPLQVNSATQPFADSDSPGDDWSYINSDSEYVYVAWPDGRNGDTIDGILARVPIALYK